MLKKTIDDIVSYIEFLRGCGFGVSIGCLDKAFEFCHPWLAPLEPNPVPVCAFLRAHLETREECSAHCDALFELLGEDMLAHTCHAGVGGYAVPVLHGGREIAVVRVMGYKLESPSLTLSDPEANERFLCLARELSERLPDGGDVRALAAPLSYMLGRLYELCCEHSAHNTVMDAYRKSLIYIREHFTEGISVADVAKGIGYSVSYFGYIFKKNRGISANKYISELQLDRAAELLQSTVYSVSDIAERVGFSDPNYFSTAFKARFSVSPRQYREKKKA